ncbi:HNH endonuclease [Deinococcus taeanensis]|uniref:HNH endonuclease n=1 Tax=Deinococcus taeanensis TaxID=2737050 RepID=UPI001CDC0777|nr:HNH endonuclease [Deinococcus taeanensis]UBV43405.1 HNH endonuclease [Deinococcus taeanensis]
MARRQPEFTWPPAPRPEEPCALCSRTVPNLTEHHLLPRSQGRRQGLRVADLPTTRLCPACHKFLHRTFTNAELAREYRDLETLRAHPDVHRFVAWIRKQPVTRAVRVR